MAQNKTILVFPNLRLLWEFAQAIKVNSMEIRTASRTLICDCEDVDVQLAETRYKAEVKNNSFVSH